MRPSEYGGVVVPVEGRVLGITRGTDLQNIEVPGGGRDLEDASVAHTAARELREETGVVVPVDCLQPVAYTPRGPYTTFVAHCIESWPAQLRSVPFEGYVGLWPPEAFLGPGCKHREYTAELFAELGLI